MDPPTVNENDTICIQPQIFCPQPKLPLIQIDFNVLKKSGAKGSEGNRNVDSFVLALSDARKAFVAALQTTETSKGTFDKSLQEYISLLLVLIDGPAAPSLPDTQAASSSQPSTSALDCSPDTFKKESALRYAVKFSWTQSFVARGPVTAGDALYELASVLISAAVALIRHVNTKYLESTPRGVTSKSSGEAYKLLREAAGLLEYAATSVAPRIESPLPEVDTSDYVLKAAVNCTLADAQSISVLRAIKKGNQSALIASLARDTCDLYASAETLLASYPKAVGSKLDEYMKYKAAAFEAYAHVFRGITAWKARQLGGALRCLMDAESAFFSAKKAASVFDKAMPVSLGHVHARFDDELDRILYDTKRRIERENTTVYFQSIPTAPLPLLPPQRLAAPTAFRPPQKNNLADELRPDAFNSSLSHSWGYVTSLPQRNQDHPKKYSGRVGCICI